MRSLSMIAAALISTSIAVAPAMAVKPSNPGNPGNPGHPFGGNGAGGGGPQQTPLATCAAGDISIAALQCSGFVAGNALSGSGAGLTAQTQGLSSIGFAWDGNFAAAVKFDGAGSKVIDFGQALYGDTYFGIHFGAANGGTSVGGNGGTAFYKFYAGTTGITSIATIFNGSSGVVLYKTGTAPLPPEEPAAVPEPSSWAMMLFGFGVLGSALRRRPKVMGTLQRVS